MFLAVWCSRCGKTVRIHERNCHPPAASHNMSCSYLLTTTTITTTIMDSNTHYFNYQTSDIFNRRYGGIPPHTNGFWWPQDTTFSSFMSNSIICLAASSSLPMSLLLLPQPIHPPTNDLLGAQQRSQQPLFHDRRTSSHTHPPTYPFHLSTYTFPPNPTWSSRRSRHPPRRRKRLLQPYPSI